MSSIVICRISLSFHKRVLTLIRRYCVLLLTVLKAASFVEPGRSYRRDMVVVLCDNLYCTSTLCRAAVLHIFQVTIDS
jgi:hypothetical protein